MSVFKFSSVATFLVVISIIRYTFANSTRINKCQETILKETIFFGAEDDGLNNFKKAFKHLSYDKIDQKYEEITDGDDLIKLLLTMYFDDLFENQNIALTLVKNPIEWCYYDFYKTDITIHLTNLHLVKKLLLDNSIYTCLESIVKLLANANNIFDVVSTFQNLYENWDLDSIQEIGNVVKPEEKEVESGEEESNQLSEMDEFFWDLFGTYRTVATIVTNDPTYAREYFYYFARFVDNLSDPLGENHFQSIKAFCTNSGYTYVPEY